MLNFAQKATQPVSFCKRFSVVLVLEYHQGSGKVIAPVRANWSSNSDELFRSLEIDPSLQGPYDFRQTIRQAGRMKMTMKTTSSVWDPQRQTLHTALKGLVSPADVDEW